VVFQRRNKPTTTQRIRNFFWPRTGWARAVAYTKYRLARLPGTPHSIAAGFALGAAMCFTPLVGLQLIIAMALAIVLRFSVLASALGAFVGNPWTFPFIWWLVYTTGSAMLGRDGAEPLPETLSMGYVFDNFLDIFLPMLLGSVPVGIIVWIGFYLPLKKLVTSYQTTRRERVRRGRARSGNLHDTEMEEGKALDD
jgi:uncharacterized protein